MTDPFNDYYSALGDTRTRLAEGCLRMALEAPLPAMRSLIYRLQSGRAADPISTEEWDQIVDDLSELHEAEVSRSVTNLMLRSRGQMIEQMRALLVALREAEQPGSLRDGRLQPSELTNRAAQVLAAVKATDRVLGAPQQPRSFLYFDPTPAWTVRRVTIERLTKTLVFLQDMDHATTIRVKTRKTPKYGLVPEDDLRAWPRNGLQCAIEAGRLQTPA